MKVGAITVGQSPRLDLVPDILPLMPGIEVIEAGALDGLTYEQVTTSFSPDPGDTVLVSRMADGREVRFAERCILGRVQRAVERLEGEEVSAILMLCTGSFPKFRSRVPVYFPSTIFRGFTAGLVNGRTLGVVSPDPRQTSNARRRWEAAGVGKVLCASASPYQAFDLVLDAVMELCAGGAEVVALDCMGFSTGMKRRLRSCVDVPVILPRTVLARGMAELFGEA